MKSVWFNAPAKINLGLDVIGKREDGYHEVRMVMQCIRLFDRVTITKQKQPGIRLSTNLGFLPCNENNLVYQTADLLIKEFDIPGGVDIYLEKRIPVSAGMGGGSSDSAACFLAMN
ncbi:MAG: 4-(cytidine 5'-diphospho)-2-C-methyl-D-erythritol kinase, partial [Lachnoclostridium sp.]|nr:4-(cytidine 5'-diphospho)-2-C-methyl-D-erythritol kinase [Lachnoclostridium sp.]